MFNSTTATPSHQLSPPTVMVPNNMSKFVPDLPVSGVGGSSSTSLASRLVSPLTRYGSVKKLKYSPSKVAAQQATLVQQQSAITRPLQSTPPQIIPSKLAAPSKKQK